MEETFGARLMRLRREKQFNQGELAQQAGVRQSLISMLEHGGRTGEKLQLGIALRLADALGVTVEYLATGRTRPRAKRAPQPDAAEGAA